MRLHLLCGLCGALFLPPAPSLSAPFDHAPFNAVLQAHVDSLGQVDYPALQAERSPLDAYVDSLAGCSPRNQPERFPGPAYALAYWINAYNAFVLQGIIDAYPVASVMDIAPEAGFFKVKRFRAGGESLTLDHLENQIIRPQFKDPRIHFAVNCGAVSCPPLENRAYRGRDLDARLNAAQQRFMEDPRHLRLDREQKVLHLSQILQWYGGDFIAWHPRAPASGQATVVDYLLLYLDGERASFVRAQPQLTLDFVPYDWTLNQAP